MATDCLGMDGPSDFTILRLTMRLAFFINETKPGAKAAARKLAAFAGTLGLKVVEGAKKPNVVISLGGDGTMLRCVREYPGVPVLGLNLGGLGYLSSVERKDFRRALELLAAGRYRVSDRTMISVSFEDGAEQGVALNDLLIARELSGHAVVLDLSVDGKSSTRYMADGLVIATPTGSTAYSLAAGGPVVMSDSAALVVTPLSPHALGVRPLVVSDSVRLAVTSRPRVNGVAEKVGVYADGEAVGSLAENQTVFITKAPHGAKLIELEGYDPYAVLAHKLGWSGTSC